MERRPSSSPLKEQAKRLLIRRSRTRLYRNVKALLAGDDLLGRIERLEARVHRSELHADQVIGALIRRHYCGAPLPPRELRKHVGVRHSALTFWQRGMLVSERVLELFGEAPEAPVLDWGCGSGRTRLWLRGYPAWREHYHGCDVDRDAIEWLRSQGEQNVRHTDDQPPLPYPDGYFGGLFGFSVLTHIPPELHRPWYTEFRRVLAPGGRGFLTTHGARLAAQSSDDVRTSFARDGHVYRTREGHYKHLSIVSEEYTRAALDGLLEVESYGFDDVLKQVGVLVRCP